MLTFTYSSHSFDPVTVIAVVYDRWLFLPPNTGEGGLDLLLEAGEQFAVGGHQRLLGFDLRHDGLLRGEGLC